MEFKPDDIVENAKPTIERVLRFRNGYNESSITDLFLTEPGRILGNQIQGLLEFVYKMSTRSMVVDFLAFSRKIKDGVVEGEAQIIADEGYEQVFQKGLKQIIDHFLTGKRNGVISESEDSLLDIDALWFISLVAFALHSYLETYTTGVLKLLESKPRLVKEIKEYLESTMDEESRRHKQTLDPISKIKQKGMKGRLVSLSKALALDEIVSEVVGATETDAIRKGFSQYVKIRGKVAHRSPRLALHEYNRPEFEKDVADYVVESKYTPPIFQDMPHMKEANEIITKALNEAFFLILKSHTIIEMATIYPALLDCVLFAKTAQEDGT